jgi:amino acid transporter
VSNEETGPRKDATRGSLEAKPVEGLRRNTIGTFRLLWMAMGELSIAADAAYLLTGVALLALGATPLSILLGAVFYLFLMNTGYQFSKYVGSAGGYYGFAGTSLGGKAATFQAWNMAFYIPLGLGSFGFLGLASFVTLINPAYSGPQYWVPIAVVAAAIAFVFAYIGLKPSTDYQIIGGLIEVGILIVGSAAIIAASGPSNTLQVFTLKYLPGGVSQLFYSMIYSVVLYFGTVLTVTSLAEETKQPEKSAPKALASAVAVAVTTLVIVSYALTVGWGPANMSSFASSPDPGLILFHKVSYVLYALLIIFTVNSFMGYNVAVTNAAARNFYAFARDRVLFLPSSLKKIHKRHATPNVSAVFVFLVSLVISLIFGAIYGPFMGGLWLLFANGYAAYTEHIVASIGLPFFARRKGVFNVFKHLVFPVVAVGVLLAVMVSTVYPSFPAAPLNSAVYVGIGWVGFSGLMTLVEWKIHPQIVNSSGQFNVLDSEQKNS